QTATLALHDALPIENMRAFTRHVRWTLASAPPTAREKRDEWVVQARWRSSNAWNGRSRGGVTAAATSCPAKARVTIMCSSRGDAAFRVRNDRSSPNAA